MQRLTKKREDGLYDNSYNICDEEACKLGKLEDIEDAIKCPLLFCITPFKISGLKQIWYRKRYCDVVRIVLYEEGTRPYMEVRVAELKYLKMVFLDQYKETWALTREELE